MLRLMLNAHSRIAIPHDTGAMWIQHFRDAEAHQAFASAQGSARVVDAVLRDPRLESWGVSLDREVLLEAPAPRDFGQLLERFHAAFAAQHLKPRWGDKNTGTLVELDRINRWFPNCQIVHIVRDGRDCALSHLDQAYAYGYENLLRVAQEWREQVGLCTRTGAMLPPERFLEIRYEDLVTRPEAVLRQVCAFLGEAFEPSMLGYHHAIDGNVPKDRLYLWPKLDRPPDAGNAQKWRRAMSSTDIAVFEGVASDLLRHFGYPVSGSTAGLRVRLMKAWYRAHSGIAWRIAHVKRGWQRMRLERKEREALPRTDE